MRYTLVRPKDLSVWYVVDSRDPRVGIVKTSHRVTEARAYAARLNRAQSELDRASKP